MQPLRILDLRQCLIWIISSCYDKRRIKSRILPNFLLNYILAGPTTKTTVEMFHWPNHIHLMFFQLPNQVFKTAMIESNVTSKSTE